MRIEDVVEWCEVWYIRVYMVGLMRFVSERL